MQGTDQAGATRRATFAPTVVDPRCEDKAVEHDSACERGRVVSTGAVDTGDGAAHTEDEHRGEGEECVTGHDSSSCYTAGLATCGGQASQYGQAKAVRMTKDA